MRNSALLIAGSVMASLSLTVRSADPASDPYGLWKPYPAIYKIHSGIVSDRTAPTSNDRVLTVLVDGPAAKEIFESIGPDSPDKRSGAEGDREREKKGVNCIYTAQLSNPKSSHYRCWIGLNLETGEGDVRVSC